MSRLRLSCSLVSDMMSPTHSGNPPNVGPPANVDRLSWTNSLGPEITVRALVSQLTVASFTSTITVPAHVCAMASQDPSTLALEDAPILNFNHTRDNIAALIQEIQHASPSTTCSTNPADLTATSSTTHSYAPPEHVSKAVFYPQTTEDTSAILRACHRRRVAVTAYSGGTSLPGALTNSRGGVCVHFGGMEKVLGVNEGDLDVRVQPGIGWVELNEYVESYVS